MASFLYPCARCRVPVRFMRERPADADATFCETCGPKAEARAAKLATQSAPPAPRFQTRPPEKGQKKVKV